MKSPLRILHLEDDPLDAALVQSTLETADIPCVIRCVQNREDFLTALATGGFDLMLSDCALPSFDGMEAMKLAHTEQPDLPVILVSGTMGEELAIDSLKNGATDYVLKGRLARLVPAVRRAMHEVDERIERRRLEEQFIEAQKMEVIGQLASGMAHDFNHILAVIMGYSDLITSDLALDSPLRKYTEEIRHATERAAGLTRQLLVFSRKQTELPVVLDLNDAVKEMEKMLLRLISDKIELILIPRLHIGRIKADSGHLGQVLMNLVVNARDAMPHNGRITITTENVTLDQDYARGHPDAAPGNYVMLSVSDTGAGMTEEVKAHLFEPFFTTKPSGKGTGLGLATCQTIVHQSGGHIAVASELGSGTTFKIYFPRVDQPLSDAGRTNGNEPFLRGTETLLIVEDEPAANRLTCRVLKAQGYEVLSATNGQDALRIAREHTRSPIRLVVTDAVMPLMGGKVMVKRLKTTYPDLKILFTSGDTNAGTRLGGLEHESGFLPKPFTPGTLVRKVREMLDEPTATPKLLGPRPRMG